MINDKDREQLVILRLENAHQTMKEARLMLDNEYWNAAINRMYYACYYAATALLLNNGIEAQTHGGVRQMLGLHFVRTRQLSVKLNDYYSNLFAKRHSGDYDVFIFFDKDTVETIYPQAEEFIAATEGLIKRS
jgi:uncharacterized protein (UPF0332 family)